MFFQVYPFNRLISERHNIPELWDATSLNDLYIFKNLAHLKDENTLFYTLVRAHCGKYAFDCNAKSISKYIIRQSKKLALFTNDLESLMAARMIQEIGDYDQLIAFLFEYPSVIDSLIKPFNIRDIRLIIRKLMILNRDQDPSNPKKVNFYVAFLDKMEDYVVIEKYISASIMENVPEEFYREHLIKTRFLIRSVLRTVLIKTPKSESEEENLNVSNCISRLLNYLQSKMSDQIVLRDLKKYSIMNRMRHDTIDCGNYKPELLELEPDILEKLDIEIVAAMGKKDVHYQDIHDNIPDLIRAADNLLFGETAIYLLLNYINTLKHEDQLSQLDKAAYFEKFMLAYNVTDAFHDLENGMLFLTLRLKPSYEKVGLPERFIYPIKISVRNITVDLVVRTCFMDYGDDSYHDKETITGILRGLTTFPSASDFWQYTAERPIKTTSQVMKIISDFDELVQIVIQNGIKFQLETIHLARLLEHDVHNLSGILLRINIPGLLANIKSERQLFNIEKFFGNNVADMFFEEVAGEIGSGNEESSSFDYRNVYHYWLKTPQREKILNLDSKILNHFAKELDLEDSRFVLRKLKKN